MQSSGYFSQNYTVARQVFLTAAQESGATVETFRHPLTNADSVALFTDVAFLGPKDADRVLLLISGTHGVEGFAGSAIQTGLLRTSLSTWSSQMTRIVMIHAINPFGFANLRRCNEDNIDINRNFIDHNVPSPVNLAYLKLSAALNPKSLSLAVILMSQLSIALYRLRHGQIGLQEAVTHGQYTEPRGLFYGGRSPAWSNRIFREITARHLDRSTRMISIDFHTGLGPFGYGEVILNNSENDLAYRRAVNWWGQKRVTSTVAGNSVSSHLSGTINIALTQMLPKTEVTAVGLEFGTLSPIAVFKAIKEENWLHHHGSPDHPAAARIKQKMLRAFYPDDPLWKRKVWEQGQIVIEQGLSALDG